jgi:hypothetical protein
MLPGVDLWEYCVMWLVDPTAGFLLESCVCVCIVLTA